MKRRATGNYIVVEDRTRRVLSKQGWTEDVDQGRVFDNMLTAKEYCDDVGIPAGVGRIIALSLPIKWVKPWGPEDFRSREG